jgi:general secretion pathway protein F
MMMPRFRYKAVTAAGEVVEGEIDGSSRTAVIEQLRRQGSLPIRADEHVSRLVHRKTGRGFGQRRITLKDLLVFTQELATLLRAGLPLDRALSFVADLAEKPEFKTLAGNVLEKVRSGASFADALQAEGDIFPNVYTGMVRAGEAGGSLDTVLAQLGEMLARRQALEENVRSALQYPIFVLIAASVSVVILLTVVIPELRPLFKGAGVMLPWSTQIVIALSDGFRTYWWALGLAVALGLLGLRWMMRSPAMRHRRDALILRLPLFGDLVKKIEATRFSQTLGTLLRNGVTVLSALSITLETLGNRVIAQAVADVRGQLKKGDGLAQPLMKAGVFPPMAVHLIQVGEESGQLKEMLGRVAEIYEEEVKRTIQRVLALLVPLITVALGVLVAGIIGSVLSAILSSYNVAF